MNDQSSYAAKDLAPLTQTLTTSTGGSTTREIPGETIKGMIGFFKDSISQFQRINTIQADSYSGYWLTQGERIRLWNKYHTNYATFKSDFLVAFAFAWDNFQTYLQSYKQYNYFPDEYTLYPSEYVGPALSDLSYTFGYGSLSAGHLDLTKADKSFGTLGQGIAADQSKYDENINEGVVDDGIMERTTTKYLEGYQSDGKPKYQRMAITFLPMSDNSDTSKTAKAQVMGKNVTFMSTPNSPGPDVNDYKEDTLATIVQMADTHIGSHYLKLAYPITFMLTLQMNI